MFKDFTCTGGAGLSFYEDDDALSPSLQEIKVKALARTYVQAAQGNLESLKSATLAAYPGLKEEQDNLDFGYNLAVFPDDPVKLAKPEEAAATTNPFLKFAKDLTNPMNANAGK